MHMYSYCRPTFFTRRKFEARVSVCEIVHGTARGKGLKVRGTFTEKYAPSGNYKANGI